MEKRGRVLSVFLIIGLFFLSASSLARTGQAFWKVWEGKLNINQASEADFTQLDGIGKVTAHRIVEYRTRMDGFKSIMQLKEVKGVSNERLNRLRDNLTLFDASDLKVLVDINLAPARVFISLPGISKKLAEAIVEYRERNEGFEEVEELLFIQGISKPKFEELKSFVTVKSPAIKTRENP